MMCISFLINITQVGYGLKKKKKFSQGHAPYISSPINLIFKPQIHFSQSLSCWNFFPKMKIKMKWAWLITFSCIPYRLLVILIEHSGDIQSCLVNMFTKLLLGLIDRTQMGELFVCNYSYSVGCLAMKLSMIALRLFFRIELAEIPC